MAEASRTKPTRRESISPAHVLVIEARFYDAIQDQLLAGALAALEEAGATYDVVSVPGALEIPGAVAIAYQATAPSYDAMVALGCIIRGETYHFDIVANESSRGLTDFGMAHAFPIGNAILTVENLEQAEMRADPAQGNKGGEAVDAALALLRLKRGLGVR